VVHGTPYRPGSLRDPGILAHGLAGPRD